MIFASLYPAGYKELWCVFIDGGECGTCSGDRTYPTSGRNRWGCTHAVPRACVVGELVMVQVETEVFNIFFRLNILEVYIEFNQFMNPVITVIKMGT